MLERHGTSVEGRIEEPSSVGGKRLGEAAVAASGSAGVDAGLASDAEVGVDVGSEAGDGLQTQHVAVGCFAAVGSCHHSTSSSQHYRYVLAAALQSQPIAFPSRRPSAQ